jgi:hypothetical protein
MKSNPVFRAIVNFAIMCTKVGILVHMYKAVYLFLIMSMSTEGTPAQNPLGQIACGGYPRGVWLQGPPF